jgi:uncharacterized protein DUF4038
MTLLRLTAGNIRRMRLRLASAASVIALSAVVATLAAPPAAFPLRVSADRHHLQDNSGAPFLVVGDTAWSLVAQLNQTDIEHYLDDRAARGFNAIIVNLLEHKFATHAPATLGGVQPFGAGRMFEAPNAEYFDIADRAIAAAGHRGISVWLCPAYLGWDGGDEGFFKEINAAGQDALRNYGRFVGERFKDLPNIVWMLGGDFAFPPSHRWLGDVLAAGLREGGARQLMTAHGGQTAAVETFGDRDWIAVDTVYSYSKDLREPLQAARLRRPQRPFVLIESTYEGEHDAPPEQIRFQAWAAMLSGAAGQFFGNNPIWHFDGPTLFKYEGSWRQALDSVGSRDMARLGTFFRSQRWIDFQPVADGQVITTDTGTAPVAARNTDGTTTIVYVPAHGTGTRELRLKSQHSGRAQWFDPAGDASPVNATIDRDASSRLLVHTPGRNSAGATDWVLILR